MEWVASTLHTTPEHGVSRITTADAHTSATSSRRNWRPSRFKWTIPFRRKTKSAFCVCAITFQTQSTTNEEETDLSYRHITLSEKAKICSYWQINKVKWNSLLSFRSPSRNKRCVMNLCLSDSITAPAADVPHRSVSCEHFDVVDVDFIVDYGRMQWQITTERHVTSSQSLTFPIPLRWHRPLQDRETKA